MGERQPSCQSVNQLVSHDVNQSVSQWISQSANHDVSRDLSKSINQPVNHWVCQSVSQSVSQSVNRPCAWPNDTSDFLYNLIWIDLTSQPLTWLPKIGEWMLFSTCLPLLSLPLSVGPMSLDSIIWDPWSLSLSLSLPFSTLFTSNLSTSLLKNFGLIMRERNRDRDRDRERRRERDLVKERVS